MNKLKRITPICIINTKLHLLIETPIQWTTLKINISKHLWSIKIMLVIRIWELDQVICQILSIHHMDSKIKELLTQQLILESQSIPSRGHPMLISTQAISISVWMLLQWQEIYNSLHKNLISITEVQWLLFKLICIRTFTLIWIIMEWT